LRSGTSSILADRADKRLAGARSGSEDAAVAQGLGAAPPTQQLFVHQVGDLAEVLSNLGVFRMHPEDVLALCPEGHGNPRSPVQLARS
jgi:hypothetical protein